MEASKGVRIGVLTDGKYWVLRWPNAAKVNTSPPYAFTLTDADRWYALYEWLRDNASSRSEGYRAYELRRYGTSSVRRVRCTSARSTRCVALYERFSGV